MRYRFKAIFYILLFVTLFFSTPSFAKTLEYEGIDVSFWQGEIDFEKVKSDEKKIVYIRTGEGFYEDVRFRENADGAKSNGIDFGFYFYVTAQNKEEAEKQAEYFASIIDGYSYNCRPAIDFEEFGELSNYEINEIAISFAKTLLDKTGIIPLFYTDSYNAENLWYDELKKYPLWIADYSVAEPESMGAWSDFTGFQYSDSGRVNGISGDVDLDRFTSDVFISEQEKNNVTGVPFYDVKENEWFYKYVADVYKKGLMESVNKTLFLPNDYALRDMIVSVIYRMEGQPYVSRISLVTDVNFNKWYTDSMIWAEKNWIAYGCGYNMFYPEKAASREEAVVFLYRYAKFKGYELSIEADLKKYWDADKISPWAVDAFKWALSANVVKGINDTILSPEMPITRAEFATMVSMFLNIKNK